MKVIVPGPYVRVLLLRVAETFMHVPVMRVFLVILVGCFSVDKCITVSDLYGILAVDLIYTSKTECVRVWFKYCKSISVSYVFVAHPSSWFAYDIENCLLVCLFAFIYGFVAVTFVVLYFRHDV